MILSKTRFIATLAAMISFAGAANSSWAAITSPIPTNLAFWVDANDLDGDGVAEGTGESGQTAGVISTWDDKSPTANNATATGTAQPTFQTGFLQGKPVVRFDGVDDVMKTAFFAAPLAQPTEMFLVWKSDVIPTGIGDGVIDGLTVNGRQSIIFENRAGDADPNGVGGIILFSTAAGGGASDYYHYTFGTAPIVETALWNDPTGTNDNYINGTLVKSVSTGTQALDGVTLGARFEPCCGGDGFNMNGYIAEVLIYSAPLSNADRLLTEEYLTNKWLVPEPGSLTLMAVALIGLVPLMRAKKKS